MKTPGVLIDFLTLVQEDFRLKLEQFELTKAQNFLNNNSSMAHYICKSGNKDTLNVTARTPEQNGIVERRNRTLVEAARTMLSAAKVPLFFWDEAIGN
ncbi:putative ribonuclease H-like domain-containing protein [Tanacetum coccineum]